MLKGLSEAAKRYNLTPYPAGHIERLGIPGIRFVDGPRGIAAGHATAFPVSISRAASWDTDLERRVGDAMGKETRAAGANCFAGVCINVPPFPGWGRSQESYGEDPFLVGQMGSALIEGVKRWAMTTVKHFALNSMEEARFVVDVNADEATMREAYLPHFRATVEAGADAVMSAYNAVNGEWSGQNRHLLTEILRNDWGFAGFVMTDFVFGLRDPIGSVAAGQDLEMPFRMQRARELPKALRQGRLNRADVVRAGERLIGTQLRLVVRAHPDPPANVTASIEHRALAREAAARGTVLMRNSLIDGVAALPLTETSLRTLAVLGRLADQPNLGDHGSSRVYPPDTVSVLAGLRERLGDTVVQPAVDDAEAIARADAVVVVVGMGAFDEGEAMVGSEPEALAVFGGPLKWKWVQHIALKVMARQMARRDLGGGDRRDLHLHDQDADLITRVAAVNPRTIVVLIGGGTLMTDPWDQHVAAVLHAWYPGMEGGRALADILLGDAEPTGRLPVAIPAHREDLPVVDWRASTVTYPRWFGQQKLDRDGVAAAYPLGFGLGYTTFDITDLAVGNLEGDVFTATVTVRNTGARVGRHVVQIYATQAVDSEVAVRALVGFAVVSADAQTSSVVEVHCSTRPMQRWTRNRLQLTVGAIGIEAASHAGDPKAKAAVLEVIPKDSPPAAQS
jgi:beta-glucosidase